MDFMNAMKQTLNNESITENGAIGYQTTGKELLDLNFAVASLRSMTDEEVVRYFMRAFNEDKLSAMVWLFYARDIRGGLGERRLFRTILSNLDPKFVVPIISLIPEYGRYDDMWCLLDNNNTASVVYKIVREQLTKDLKDMQENKPISLLAKWLPSINASSAKTKEYGKKLCKAFRMSECEYRKILSKLRKYLDVVEVKMSANNWSEINYENVPSRANLIYDNAFLRNDEERRREYLLALKEGKTKINSSVLFPHDIVNKYMWKREENSALEALWEALPNTVNNCDNTIVVADGSGSMGSRIDPSSSTTALDVANALAIYFSERLIGQFKNKYITFSENPQFVDFSDCNSLFSKINKALDYDECSNTNIEAVFDLILKTAIRYNMRQDDLPKNILIISDMEFDACARDDNGRRFENKRLFKVISQRYEGAGYKLPRLVFWNVNSRTKTIPLTENDCGVALVSGFSTNIAKMVMSNELDPFKCLLEVLNSSRYAPVKEALDRF